MGAFLIFVGNWGHALAAVLFAVTGIVLLRRCDQAMEPRLIAAALLLTSCWALYIAFGGVARTLSGLGENVRNAAWLVAMFVLLRRGPAGRSGSIRAVTAVYASVAGLIVGQTFVDLIWRHLPPDGDLHHTLVTVSLILRMMMAIGSLLLVHHLYTAWPSRERGGTGLLLGALAAMWTYDFSLFAICWFAPEQANMLYALRGPMMALLAPVMAISLRHDIAGRLQLSRSLTFGSLSIFAVILYVVLLSAAAVLIDVLFGSYARVVEVGAVFAAAVAALVLLPSARLRALWKVQVAKHFFQHRYDYRTEWMRFGETIGRPGDDPAPLGQRVAKAVADITDSPAAILLLRDERGGLSFETHWNWPGEPAALPGIGADLADRLESSGWIIDLGKRRAGEEDALIPAAIAHDPHAWALAPLIHYGRLTGAILLARPPIDRRLDWEDFDMLRTAGRQAATYISEAQGQQALDDARRFDEFNRRFAFIIHDVKNLVSQLSLLARNAQRHADNPDFRADMVLTLQESVGKMNDLLARLSQHNKGRAEEPRAVPLRDLLDGIVRTRARHHPVTVRGDAPAALADPARVEQIIVHLLQNAIDASASDSPVDILLSADASAVIVDIMDRGCGMSAEYIRRDLFKPFSSSKVNGFGIGAFEARTLAQAMGGRIDVESQSGVGSRFTLRLPLAPPIPAQEKAA